MNVHVRLAEPFWRTVGQRNLDVELAGGARVADLLAALLAQYPALAQEFAEAVPLIFVDEDEATGETALADGRTIHLVWPIAGG